MLDTLSIARDLRAAALPAKQAEAIAAAIGRAVSEESASKADFSHAKSELKIWAELVRLELKAVIDQCRSILETKIEQLRADMERMRNQIVLWVIGSQVALAGTIIAVIR